MKNKHWGRERGRGRGRGRGGGGGGGVIERGGLINFSPLKRGGGSLERGACLRGGLNRGFTVT